MESYSYKYRGRGWGHSLPLNAFLSDQRLVSRASGVRDLSSRPTRKSVLTSEARKDLSPNPTKGFYPERWVEPGRFFWAGFVNYSASKHGRMTLATRQTLAAEAISWGDCVVKL
jgi:hypothetical protein